MSPYYTSNMWAAWQMKCDRHPSSSRGSSLVKYLKYFHEEANIAIFCQLLPFQCILVLNVRLIFYETSEKKNIGVALLQRNELHVLVERLNCRKTQSILLQNVVVVTNLRFLEYFDTACICTALHRQTLGVKRNWIQLKVERSGYIPRTIWMVYQLENCLI